MSEQPVLAPVSHLLRPETPAVRRDAIDIAAHRLLGWVKRPWRARLGPHLRVADRVLALESRYAAMGDDAIAAEARRLGFVLAETAFGDAAVAESFALAREVSGRVLGMRHFHSQVIGGLVLLRGCVAEMATGEGKTLTTVLPAVTAALAGIPVHVVSVNDYLTRRDAELMGPVYQALGLSVGVVVQGMSPPERRAAYAARITYCTNKELTFDYLKDQLVLGERTHPLHLHVDRLHGGGSAEQRVLLRGLHFAIVDEVDSILVDEARTPLVISGTEPANEGEETVFRQAMSLARTLVKDEHWQLIAGRRQIELTAAGREFVRAAAAELGPYWSGRVRREELATQALTAIHLFHRDSHYLVRDGKVQIIDEFTGRVMADRSWERGLHQLIEIKEGCEPTRPRKTLAKISYQRFFRKYLHLAGMTGTAQEIRRELWDVYGLAVVAVPLNRPSRRRRLQDQVFPSGDDKWARVLDRVATLHAERRAVLVGTASVAASEELSRLLTARGLPHRVLNAKQDAEEAAIVAEAGQPGRITVATSMAGRGTDIALAPEVAAVGGLHVILTERHEAARIDRQLEGRCARQGDPGSCEAILSLDGVLFEDGRGGMLLHLARAMAPSRLRDRIAALAIRRAQKRLEAVHARARALLLKDDERQADLVAFSGRKL